MSDDTSLKVQAWLDGELVPSEAAALGRVVAGDPQAQALAAELRRTKSALAVGELPRVLPESREFYWSRIERAMRETESRPEAAPESSRVASLFRWFAPAALAAGLAALVALPLLQKRGGGGWGNGAEIESPLEDISSFTFRSEADRMTVVWINAR